MKYQTTKITVLVILIIAIVLMFCVVANNNGQAQKNNLKPKIDNSIAMECSIELEMDAHIYRINKAQLTYFIDVFCNDTVNGQILKGAPFMSFTFQKQDGSLIKLHLIMIDKERFSLQGDVNDGFTYYGELNVVKIKDIVLKLDSIDNRLLDEILSCDVFKVLPYSLIDFSKWKR